MKTKKCKVVIVPYKDITGDKWYNYPLITAINDKYKEVWSNLEQINSTFELSHVPWGSTVAHLELHDESDYIIASTKLSSFDNKHPNEVYVSYRIPQSFIDEFIEKNGQIKEVLVEMGNGLDTVEIEREVYDNSFFPKLNSDGCVIIHPVKTEMKIEDIPINAIKNCIAYCERNFVYDKLGYHGDFNHRIKQWLKENNL
jgi:hypothetical protein